MSVNTDLKDKIEMARTLLHNAARMNARKEIIYRLSQVVDRYIVEYMRKCSEEKGGCCR